MDQLQAAGPFDWTVGYSLGSLLLLLEAPGERFIGRRVALLAPIFGFASEDVAWARRVPRAQVRQLFPLAQAQEPLAALADFYGRAVLHVPPDLPGGAPEILLWGLGQLEKYRVAPPLPPGWLAWCGSDDALLDAARLHALDPAVTIVPGGTHHPHELIEAFARAVT